MAKKLWEIAQDDFVASFTFKEQFVFQFHDARAAMGAGQSKRIFTTEHPSDFLVTSFGTTYYAEVKSCSDEVSFTFSNIRPGQWKAAIRVTKAQGLYFFFVKSEHLKQWYKIPASAILAISDLGFKSVKWADLNDLKWEM